MLWVAVNADIVRDLHFGGGFVAKTGGGDGDEGEGKVGLHHFYLVSAYVRLGLHFFSLAKFLIHDECVSAWGL